MKIISSAIAVVFSLFVFSTTVWAEKPFAPDKLQGTIRVDAEETVELIVNTPNLVIVDSRKEIEFSKGAISTAPGKTPPAKK